MIVNRISPKDAKYRRLVTINSALLAISLVCAAWAATHDDWVYLAVEAAICAGLISIIYFDVRASRRH